MRATTHRVIVGGSSRMTEIPDGTVELVVTSPPYPMIAMWDGLFSTVDPEIARALDQGKGEEAFSRMHAVLEGTWREVVRVLRPGGIACVNVGDAARTLGGRFEVFPNHVAVSHAFRRLGLHSLPTVLWRKPTNKPNKFLGSGMLPAGAYATLEHEHVLILRKGGVRAFSPADRLRRRESAYFWEERNTWFSDVWTGLRGERQGTARASPGRSRSAAFPFELPYRLIAMHSLLGDTVLDPFLGTGTTMLAAMALGRDSVGYEIDGVLAGEIGARVREEFPGLARPGEERLASHRRFIEDEGARGRVFAHRSRPYGFPVVTGQESDLELPVPEGWTETAPGSFEVRYASERVPE